MKKMGNLADIMNMIPGLSSKLKGADPNVDEKQIEKVKAIILSMTPEEGKPEIIKVPAAQEDCRGQRHHRAGCKQAA